MQYSELEPLARSELSSRLYEAGREARELTVSIGQEAVHYLLLTNGGAAIALLTYMGTSDAIRQALPAWWSLGVYLLGILAVGVLLMINFFVTRKLMVELAIDTQRLFKDDITVVAFQQRRPLIKIPKSSDIVGSIALACFIAGSLIALIGLYPVVNARGSGVNVSAIAPIGNAASQIPKQETAKETGFGFTVIAPTGTAKSTPDNELKK